MIKTKILFILINVIIAIYSFHFGVLIFVPELPYLIEPKNIFFIINIIVEITIFIAMISLSIGLFKIIKKGFFQAKSSKFLVISGILITIAAVLDIFVCIEAMIKIDRPDLFFQRTITNFLLLILGLATLLASDVLKNGSFIKNENDLTI